MVTRPADLARAAIGIRHTLHAHLVPGVTDAVRAVIILETLDARVLSSVTDRGVPTAIAIRGALDAGPGGVVTNQTWCARIVARGALDADVIHLIADRRAGRAVGIGDTLHADIGRGVTELVGSASGVIEALDTIAASLIAIWRRPGAGIGCASAFHTGMRRGVANQPQARAVAIVDTLDTGMRARVAHARRTVNVADALNACMARRIADWSVTAAVGVGDAGHAGIRR